MPFSALLNEPGLGAQSRDLITTQASQWAQACGFEPLPPYLPHLLTLEQLPPISAIRHRDQFDRLLVAQSISESLLLLSADAAFRAYGCPLAGCPSLS